jgi:tetratricopeptide (TPR) repeat protein
VNPERRRDLWLTLLVVAAACAAYAAALAGDFVYDDVHSVSANPAIADLGNLGRFFTDPGAFSATAGRMYRPVLLCTLALDHALGGAAPLWFKATNVLLHAATAALLLAVLRGLSCPRRGAVLAALIFAVHPLAAEAVNLVSARSEVLLVLGLWLGLRCQQAQLRGHRAAWLGVLFASFVACGSKETGVVLPVLLLLQEWLLAPAGARLRQLAAPALLRVLPCALLTLGYLLTRKLLLGSATAALLLRSGSDVLSGAGRDLVTQLATMGTLLPRALLQMLVPSGLSLDPAVQFHRSFDLPAIAGWSLLLLLSLLAIRRGSAAARLGVAFAWLTALPWIVFPLNVPLAEHRLYGPLAGVLAALAPMLACLPATIAAPRRGLWLLPAAVLPLFAVISAQRSLDYRDERLLWAPVIAAQPNNFRAHWAMGLAATRAGDLGAALGHLERASCLYPSHRSAKIAWLETLAMLTDAASRPFLGLVLAADLLAEKDEPYVRILRANVAIQAGALTGDAAYYRTAEAVALSCLDIAPPKGLVFRVAASARAHAGDLAGAIALLDRSVAIGCDHVSVLLDRAELLRQAGRMPEADRDLELCMQRAPFDPAVQGALQRLRGAGPPR